MLQRKPNLAKLPHGERAHLPNFHTPSAPGKATMSGGSDQEEVGMSKAPSQQDGTSSSGACHRGSHRRRRLILPREQDPDEIRRDSRIRRGWLGHSWGSQLPGDMEGCVHGGSVFGSFAAGESSRQLTEEHPFRVRDRAEHLRKEALSWEAELHRIERTIVLPICINPDAGGRRFFPDRAERLNRYLTAAKQLLQTKTTGDVDHRKKSLLKTVMSSIAAEFCHLTVWRLDDVARRDYSPASIWKSVRRRHGSDYSAASSQNSASSGYFTSSCGNTSDASYGSSYLSEELTVRSYNSCSGMILTDRKSLPILDEIASIMIPAGYEQVLRGAFDGHCAQLARYIEIFDIDNILGDHMEEPREILLKVWTSAMRIIIGFLREMHRQLNEQDLGSFHALKEDYFCAIAKASVLKLLKAANSICIQVDTRIDPSCKDTYEVLKSDLSKMVNVAMMYQALNYGMPIILTLFSGEAKELIIAEGECHLDRLSRVFFKLYGDLDNLVRSQRLFIIHTGVHRATRCIMHHLLLLFEHKNTISLMLKGGMKAFGELVTRLVSSLEFMLDTSSRSLQLQGQQHIFLLNNVQFLLEEVEKNTELRQILGERWLSRCHDLRDQCVEGYLDASWTSVTSLLEKPTLFPTILWRHQMLDKFTSTFEITYTVQKNWKVTDPLTRQMLREAISLKVIPLYRMHMENHSEKSHKSARYSIEQLESQLLELFEG